MKKSVSDFLFTNEKIKGINTKSDLEKLLEKENVKLDKILSVMQYEEELLYLQIQLLKLQKWILNNGKRVVVIFEGRDAAGKGGAIRRFTRYLNPRSMRVVALGKPTDLETGHWYFRRHVKELPNRGEIVFFDRSWYNRAVIEPVMGFCSEDQYQEFMRQVPEFEHMLYEDGVDIIKFWFTITKDEQGKRFNSRKNDPLKKWKLSPIDRQAQAKWDIITHYKEEMFSRTHTSYAPWLVIRANNKRKARLESIRYLLSHFEYDDRKGSRVNLYPDPDIIVRFHRSVLKENQ